MKKTLFTKLAVFTVLAGLVIIAWTVPVLASSRVAISDNGVFTVAPNETVDGAVFMVGETITVAGKVNGDLYCAAETVHIYGEIDGDVICVGGNLTIEGKVDGDIRVAGSIITINGMASGNLTAAANTLTIDKKAVIQQDALLAGSSIRINGVVQRDIRAGSESIEINGLVGRHVEVETTKLVVSEGARVGGDVQYWSQDDAEIYKGTVAGQAIRHESISRETTPTVADSILNIASGIFFLVILTIAMVLIVPRNVRETTALSLPKLGFVFLVGLAAILLSIPILIVLIFTIIGAPIIPLLIVGYAVIFTTAFPLTSYYLGRWMFEGRSSNMILHATAGAAALGLLIAVPIVGVLIGLIAFVTGVGMAIYNLRHQFKEHSYKDTQKISSLSEANTPVNNSIGKRPSKN
ncbi:polymer-forming cytoskeletal protein [Candidatus Saccharibacteria bacterium]|nr:polymer-forming cytoskeletal protein [Candidatus Saccharibacteria bacterium]NCU40271.1 polymer-forming cytoskeletal protein [Candidatus Saccharibacteria bacterium]